MGDFVKRILILHLSTFSKDFSSETTRTISFKFHMQPPCKGGKKVYIFGPGHLTKMAVITIYDKTKTISSPELVSTCPLNLV